MNNRNYVKTPTVFQMEATECGAASLAMVLGYFGCHIPLEKLRIDTGVNRNGVNAKNIYYAAEKYGLQVKGYSKRFESLKDLPLPCIIHWNFNHFVVFEGIRKNQFIINDPAQGRRKLSLEEASECFTGIVLTFTPGPDFKKTAKEGKTSRLAVTRISGEKETMMALFILGLLLVVPGIVIPVFSQIFMDHILLEGMHEWMLPLLLAMLMVLVFSVLFRSLRAAVLVKLQAKMSLVSSYRFMKLMFSLPIPFFEQRYSGDLAERIKNNNSVNEFLAGDLGQVMLDMFVALFYILLMLVYSPLMTLIVLICTFISVLYAIVSSKKMESLSKKTQQDTGKLVGALYFGLSIIDTLKASGSENAYVSRILGYNAGVMANTQIVGRTQQILNAVPQAISRVTNVIILAVGGITVINGEMTPGMLVAFVMLLNAFTAPILSITGMFQKLQQFKADVARVEDINNYPVPERNEVNKEAGIAERKLTGLVEFQDVSFGYSEFSPPLIDNFTFTLKPGSSVALVGPSGCGKSTVAKLVSGLTAPWGGSVTIDGMAIDEIPKNVFNVSVSTVSQEISLFSGTIRENLTLWNPMIMEKDIVQAAKDACIHDTIINHMGAYDYHISEGGKNLSGGQRQRLEIARALATDPSVLVMDEATSALDPIVEKEVMDNIRRRGCSLVVVAHRLSTIRDCDEILVMDRGRILERGTHEELMAQGGVYEELIRNA